MPSYTDVITEKEAEIDRLRTLVAAGDVLLKEQRRILNLAISIVDHFAVRERKMVGAKDIRMIEEFKLEML